MAQNASPAKDWTSLVDLSRLATWMDDQGLGEGGISDVTPLVGGTQNILLRLRRAGRAYVLRRPGRHPRAHSNTTMMREARILRALTGTPVPHPALIAACEDVDVLGAAFYLMEPVDGFNATMGRLPDPHAGDPALRHRMGLAMVDGIVALGAVDIQAANLEDFGKVEHFLERQVRRWYDQLQSYASHAGWPGVDAIPGVDEVADWLSTHRPASFQPGVLHGDFHLGNVLFRHDGPQLAAIVDWELATVGDPLLDLGGLLATWPDENGVGGVSIQPGDGLPRRGELIAHYARQSPRDLSAIRWYAVLACYKLGIILEGTHARACAGLAPVEIGERLHRSTQRLFSQARGWLRDDQALLQS